MSMTLDKATSFLRMLQNGQIDRRPIGEWIGLREACGVILAHLTQPAQSVDEICDGCGSNVLITKCCECGNETYVNPQNTTAALQEKGNG